jgi:hypothetical protein
MLLRRVLIRLLLLSVFFNTVIGMPAHEAGHLQRTAAAVVTALSSQEADEDADALEHGEVAHGACAWCLAYVHLGAALTSLPAVHALAARAGLSGPRAPAAFVPSPGRWPFSSRDPPLAVS